MIERTTPQLRIWHVAAIAALFLVGASTCKWMDSMPKKHLERGDSLLNAAVAEDVRTVRNDANSHAPADSHYPPWDETHDESNELLTTSEGVCIALVVLAEAGGEPLEGKVAVADLVVNRLAKRRQAHADELPCDVVHERGQFVAAGSAGLPRPIGSDPAWHASLFAAESVLHDRAGIGPPMLHDDPTNGATCMISPANMPKDKTAWPSWARNPIATVGGHQFFTCNQ